MTPKGQIRFANAIWGLVLGTLALPVVVLCASFQISEGGTRSPESLTDWVGWAFSAPAAWFTELFHGGTCLCLFLGWLECVVVTWLFVTLCRLLMAKWRES
jgi:hypothetical protein